jgi:hypothetical protein
MLPERGDPFLERKDTPAEQLSDENGDVLPIGMERSQEVDRTDVQNNDFHVSGMPQSRLTPREDGGMRAVDPPLTEDLLDASVPPPLVEPELPPPPDRDLTSILQEQESLKGSRSSEEDLIHAAVDKPSTKRDSLLVSELRWKRLYAKADLLHERIGREIDNPHLKKLLSDQIAIACDQSLKTREEFDESERILGEVEGRIQLEEQVKRWSASLKSWVLGYELLFAIIFLVGLVLLPNVANDLISGWFPEISSRALPDIRTLIISMLWGGLGGTINALIGLWAHRALAQDIDRQWAVWFFANPFMGIVLGALLFLLMRAILLVLFPSTLGRFTLSWILYILAAIAGFEQNIFYDLIEGGMKIFEPGRKGSKSRRKL